MTERLRAGPGMGRAGRAEPEPGAVAWVGRRHSPGPDQALRRLSVAERAARGRAARARVPRASHAVFDPAPGRADPVALLEEQARSRVRELVGVRYGRMLTSPFACFRGAAAVMAADLAGTPTSGLAVQLCGDAHLSNFGLFASPERKLVFDVNDFDETLPGPWEWDVKRLAASVEVAGRGNGFSRKQRRSMVMATVTRYRESMRRLAGMANLDVWYAQVDTGELLAEFGSLMRARQRRRVEEMFARARTRDSMQELRKLTRVVDGRPRIVCQPPLVVPLADLLPGQMDDSGVESRIGDLIAAYRGTLEPGRQVLLDQFEVADMARKVVGVGSVGTRCWIILMLGRDEGDPLFLQAKQAQESVLGRFAGQSVYGNQGERVVAGQRIMQAASDIFLGWQRAEGLDGQARDFYIRQLRDWKLSLPVEAMAARGMRLYGELCGGTLARAHARSGDRIAIAAYLGRSQAFDRAVTEFAVRYADQNERDFAALGAAVSAGRLTAAPA